MRFPINATQHPLSDIVLHEWKDQTHLLAFRDSDHAVHWLDQLYSMHHKHKSTRKLLHELGELLYVIPATHNLFGQVLVGDDRYGADA